MSTHGIIGKKSCPKCKKQKSAESFHKDGKSVDGLYYICKSCAKIRNRQYRKEVSSSDPNWAKNRRDLRDKRHAFEAAFWNANEAVVTTGDWLVYLSIKVETIEAQQKQILELLKNEM